MLKEPEAPKRPSEDDTRPVSGRGDDRLLLWCLVASLFINFGFGLWMNLADVYGEQHLKQELKRAPIHIYHPPPIKKKPKPKPKPKIIPPKPIKMKVQPPKPTPTPPRPVQRVVAAPRIGHTSNAPTAINVGQVNDGPPVVAPQNPGNDITPDPPKPDPPAPPVVAPPTPVVTPPAPPPPPPAPKHPPGWNGQIESREADVIPSSIQDVSMDGIDPPPTSSCTISFEVDENGRIASVRVKKRSGSSEFDQRCVDAIRGAKGISAYQEHVPYRQRAEYTFNI